MTSECSVSCGGGTMTGTRACDNPPIRNGGESCRGIDRTSSIRCGTGLCIGESETE